jgi:hypothetical protein
MKPRKQPELNQHEHCYETSSYKPLIKETSLVLAYQQAQHSTAQIVSIRINEATLKD